MPVTPESNRQNRTTALAVSGFCAVVSLLLGFVQPIAFAGLLLCPAVFWWIRRKTLRRLRVAAQAFPRSWESVLQTHVDYFRQLDQAQQERFRILVKVFLDEVTITGIRTEVDDVTRVLVAASAVIPIFGFDDWEYAGLGEVLIYPDSFNDEYSTDTDDPNRNTLGMIGVNHLSGVMILSKPSLIAGFSNSRDKRNVGVHEFAHLVDKADGSVDGIPAGIPRDVVDPWIRWIGKELNRPVKSGEHIDDYAFTNEAEYFAVLSEYFFEAPETLAKKDPAAYQMLQSIYRQNTRKLLASRKRKKRVGRNSTCPCGSGKKFKHCCLAETNR